MRRDAPFISLGIAASEGTPAILKDTLWVAAGTGGLAIAITAGHMMRRRTGSQRISSLARDVVPRHDPIDKPHYRS